MSPKGGIALALFTAGITAIASCSTSVPVDRPVDRPAHDHPSSVVALFGPHVLCTGVLIGPDTVLTVAHCLAKPTEAAQEEHDRTRPTCPGQPSSSIARLVDDARLAGPRPEPRTEPLHVHLGSTSLRSGGEVIDAAQVIPEPRFTWEADGVSRAASDIGIVKLARTSTVAVQPARVATHAPKPGRHADVYGWDDRTGCGVGNDLQQLGGQVADKTTCTHSPLGMDEICIDTGHDGLCDGASGAPVLEVDEHGNTVVDGVFTHGRCRENPMYATDVVQYRDFITAHLTVAAR